MAYRELDFLVIGAQKAATTTLHELLSENPEICLPLAKEVPWFIKQTGEWESFFAANFDCAPTVSKVGKVTPQYISDPNAAELIRARVPAIRLIAILRNPVERTYSHFRMCVRRGEIEDDFDAAVDRWLTPEALDRARELPHVQSSEPECCVVWSEYSRMLRRYTALFPQEQFLILATSELERDPDSVLSRTLEHIGLNSNWKAPSAGTRYHQGGTQPKVRLPKPLKAIPGLASMARLVFRNLPPKWRYSYVIWNVKPSKGDVYAAHPGAAKRLTAHFGGEQAALADMFGFRANW